MKPANFEWLGFTEEQIKLLDFLDFVGNNAWSRNGQTESLMPTLMGNLSAAYLTMDQIKEAMRAVGYSRDALHQLDRWETKRTTGRFGR
jgi:hypothetical protein